MSAGLDKRKWLFVRLYGALRGLQHFESYSFEFTSETLNLGATFIAILRISGNYFDLVAIFVTFIDDPTLDFDI